MLDTAKKKAGCIILEKSFDPTGEDLRKFHMFTASEEITADAKDVVLPPNTGHTRAKRCSLKAGDMTDAKMNQRLLWIAQMQAVRDQQDKAAFAELFGYFAPRVKSFLMKSGAAHDVAEECAQDVMATLWRKAHLFDPAKASVSTWIFTIARNRRIDFLRKDRRPEPEELPWGPEAEPDQADVMALAEDTERLGAALASLPEKQRILIEKAYFGDLSHSEIATETGLPLGTIKSRIRLALERLRHAMT
ncbi:RNA polymerase sigma-70 factor, ECF subfamily [Cognatiyoonia koreensis]|uniref:RNA polymerase sigma-70 factor, ECF subfamily n=2 Tax=Cognatiyoonia koreensis TaxID=364200 RepID=A0A1I0RV98_9RHOB|nr:RNA polymerase sigma-70 factor, ECF subfamily [Cognatiyoonia koreensis]